MIRCLSGRVLEPELLDHAPDAPTRKNLEELVTINRHFGGHRILIDRLRELVSPTEAFSLLDVGAASGDMGREAARVFPRLRVTNFDRRPLHLENAGGEKVVGNAFDLPFRSKAFDFVHCSLFLHHFTNVEIVQLLGSFWDCARVGVIVQDLERHPLAYYFLPATRWLFGWSDLVVHDGPISVAAAFKPAELKQLAAEAGLESPSVRTHRPAFRISLVAVRS